MNSPAFDTPKVSPLRVAIRRVKSNFAANALGQVMSGVYQAILVPLSLHFWSKQGYGEWIVLFSIPNVLWSLEGGLSGVASNRMTVASSTGNWDLANSIFQNVLFTQGILTLLMLGCAGFFVSAVDVRAFFHFLQTTSWDSSAILMLMLCYMLIGFYMSLFRAAYRASELESRGAMASNLWRLSDFLLTVGVLVWGGSALEVAYAILGGAIFWALMMYLDVRRVCPRVEFGIKRRSWSQARSILVDGLPLLAGQAATALFLQGYPLVINRVLGATSVANFNAVRTACRTILLFNQVISTSSAPEVSRSYGRKDWETYMHLLKIMLASAFTAGLVTFVGLSVLGPWIISLWTLGKVIMSHPTLLLFGLSVALQGVCGVGSIVLVCSNMHHLYNYLYLGVTVCALTVASFALPFFGFIAVPGTMVAQDLTLTVLIFFLARSKLKHVSLADLRSIFTSDYYWGKVQTLFNRAEF